MRHRRLLSLFGALLATAFLGLSCVDQPGGGSTGGTVLYAFDNVSHTVQAWDASAFYDTDPPPSLKTIGSSVFSNKMQNLAWGGMCLDSTNNRLFLVHETTGDVVRVDHIRNQSTGTISSTSPDVVTFTLGASSSDRLPDGKFGQAAVDPGTGTLYVTENNGSDARVWMVSNAGALQNGATVPLSTLSVTGDKSCTGVAAGLSGQVYAYFESGNNIGPDQISGPRLRKGSSGGFSPSASVLVGLNTLLAKYGSLALDSGNSLVFVARHSQDSSTTGQPVLAFSTGAFNFGGFNQAPSFTLGTSADQGNIRVLAHPGNKEWLGALTSSGETPAGSIYLWKLPRDPATVVKSKSLSGIFKGIAFDGNN